MKYVYPAIFREDDNDTFCIFFPGIDFGATWGKGMADGIAMAEDFLGNVLVRLEDTKQTIPTPRTQQELMQSDEYQEGDIITFIQTDTARHRRLLSSVLVKKTLVIPAHLNQRAMDMGVNFSQTLQRALKEELQLVD